ncbi:MAG: hypothetical protein OXE48_10940 [Gammaproteobacteria bacterium]|nr:hypothetical protein [Gammaproteobacteria bacterium]
MVFEDAYSMWTEKRLTREEAAELLGVSARTFTPCLFRCIRFVADSAHDERENRHIGNINLALPLDIKGWMKAA